MTSFFGAFRKFAKIHNQLPHVCLSFRTQKLYCQRSDRREVFDIGVIFENSLRKFKIIKIWQE